MSCLWQNGASSILLIERICLNIFFDQTKSFYLHNSSFLKSEKKKKKKKEWIDIHFIYCFILYSMHYKAGEYLNSESQVMQFYLEFVTCPFFQFFRLFLAFFSVADLSNLIYFLTSILCKEIIKVRNLKFRFFFWAAAVHKCGKIVENE